MPALVAWSPYGTSQGTTPGIMGIFATIGLDKGNRVEPGPSSRWAYGSYLQLPDKAA